VRDSVNESAVVIVLSSYNGARYIDDQIESIRAQTFRKWKLLVRDDGSSDETRSIVMKHQGIDDRIELVNDNLGNLGPWASFGALLSTAAKRNPAYVFLSDQDDVWLPAKIANQLAALKRVEEMRGLDHPVLAHSDLEVVDDKLAPLHLSFREFQGISHNSDDPLRTLLLHNAVVGCTVAINRALLAVAIPLPPGSPHDWWLGLCAAATGTILSSGERTVKYRQHDSNTVGAPGKRGFVSRLLRHPGAFLSESLAAFDVGVRQSGELAERISERSPGSESIRGRPAHYAEAFGSQPLRSRLRSLRESGATPRRPLSRLLLLGLVAILPRWRARRAV
jgi:glycosyltransferase involved in cell wall biosynthesis